MPCNVCTHSVASFVHTQTAAAFSSATDASSRGWWHSSAKAAAVRAHRHAYGLQSDVDPTAQYCHVHCVHQSSTRLRSSVLQGATRGVRLCGWPGCEFTAQHSKCLINHKPNSQNHTIRLAASHSVSHIQQQQHAVVCPAAAASSPASAAVPACPHPAPLPLLAHPAARADQHIAYLRPCQQQICL